ncbi:MAG: ABC transporter substrate-binding protein [Desertimonas sp.]
MGIKTSLSALALGGAMMGSTFGGAVTAGAQPAATESTDTTAPSGIPADAEIDRDATLRYGYYIALATFDPHKSNGSNDNTWLFPVYDRLVHTTAQAEPEPGLAESWEFADDGSYLEMNLRQGVTFHDGEPFNAEAVKANIERAQTVDGSTAVALLDHITEVEVVDEFTVRLHTEYPDAALPLTLSDRAGAMISPAAFDDPDLDLNPVGAGAYRVTSYQPDAGATYERYEDYWNVDETYIKTIEIQVVIDTTTRLNALRSGQLDAAEIDAQQAADAEAAGLGLTVGTDVSFSLLQFNSVNRPEFADERVRRAINLAIDREAIVEGLMLGYGEAWVQPFPPGYYATDPDLTPESLYPYDPDQARTLLEEAGYGDGFSFEIITTSTPLRVQTSEVIQASLAELGITVSIRQVSSAGAFLEEIYNNKQGDAWMLAWGGRPDPYLTADGLYGADSFNNPSGLTTDAVTALLQESISTFDPDERAAVLRELSAEITTSTLDVAVLFFPQKIVAYREGVLNAQIWAVGRPEFRGMAVAAS